MKNLFVLALLLVLSMNAGAVQIEVWQIGLANETIQILQQMIEEEFTPETGIYVNVSVIPSDAAMSRILLAVASGEPPDVIAGTTDHLVEYGIRGAVLPLRKVYGKEFEAAEARLYPGTSQALNFYNQGYGLTQFIGAIIGFQRTDLLANLGMEYPVTWADLYAMLPRLRAQGMQVGWNYGGPVSAPQFGALTLMKQHGGGFVDGDNFVSLLDRPGSVAGFKEYVEQFTVHRIPQEIEWFNMFREGSMAILFDHAVRYTSFDRAAPELADKWSYGLMPGTPQPDGTILHESMMAGSGLGIATASLHKDEAFRYLQWYFSDEIQTQLIEAIPQKMPGAMLISGNMAAASKIPVREADQAILFRQLGVSQAFSYYPGGMAINRYVEFAVHEVLQRGTKPEDAIAQAHRQTEQELRSKRMEYQRFMERNIVR